MNDETPQLIWEAIEKIHNAEEDNSLSMVEERILRDSRKGLVQVYHAVSNN